MADKKLVGNNYTPPDLVAKVTGRAKYAEDFRADGMLFAKLLLSPMPHARVRRIDTSAALAMPGVKAILTADDLPDLNGRRARADQRAALRRASRFSPSPRSTKRPPPRPSSASTSISSRCRSSSIRSRACGPAAPTPDSTATSGDHPAASRRAQGPAAPHARDVEVDRRRTSPTRPSGRLPMGKAPEEWSYGDLDAGFKNAALVLDETFVVQSTGHHPMETRSAMAYWQNGKLYLHGSTQSVVRTVDPRRALGRHRSVGRRADQRVHRRRLRQQGRRRRVDGDSGAAVEEGQRAGDDAHQPRGGTATSAARGPAWSAARRSASRRTAASPRSISSSSRTTASYGPMGDHRSAGNAASLIWQPPAMRWRGRHRAHQHAAALAAAIAGADAGQRDHGAGRHEGGQAARPRSGRDPPDQLARGQSRLRPGRRRTASGRTSRARS